MMITTWSDGAETIRREQEADARETMEGTCTLCGDLIEGEPVEFWACDGEHHITHPTCSEFWDAVVGDTNALDVPETRHHTREVIEGGVVITYEQRDPGERDWTPVRLFRPSPPPSQSVERRVS